MRLVNELYSSDGQKVDGLFNYRTELISIENKLSPFQKAFTLGHEFLHYLSHSVLKQPSVHSIDKLIDYLNYLIEKESLIAILHERYKTIQRNKRYSEWTYESNIILIQNEEKKAKVIFRMSRRSINLSQLTNQERYDLRHGLGLLIKIKRKNESKFRFQIFKDWSNEKRFHKEA